MFQTIHILRVRSDQKSNRKTAEMRLHFANTDEDDLKIKQMPTLNLCFHVSDGRHKFFNFQDKRGCTDVYPYRASMSFSNTLSYNVVAADYKNLEICLGPGISYEDIRWPFMEITMFRVY